MCLLPGTAFGCKSRDTGGDKKTTSVQIVEIEMFLKNKNFLKLSILLPHRETGGVFSVQRADEKNLFLKNILQNAP